MTLILWDGLSDLSLSDKSSEKGDEDEVKNSRTVNYIAVHIFSLDRSDW